MEYFTALYPNGKLLRIRAKMKLHVKNHLNFFSNYCSLMRKLTQQHDYQHSNGLAYMRYFSGLNPIVCYSWRAILCAALLVFIAAYGSFVSAQLPAAPQSLDMSESSGPEFTPTISLLPCIDQNDRNCNSAAVRLPDTRNTNSIQPPQGSYSDAALNKHPKPATSDHQESPPDLTEFQRFVASTAGALLPRYGTELFRTRPDRFASNDHAAAPENLILNSDDELRIHTWGQVNISADVRVSREGEIFLPKVGPVHVAGLSFSAAKQQIIDSLSRVYRNFECTVDLGEIHTIQIYLTGHAAHPGQYSVSGLTTLVDAIFLSGGPSSSGSLRHLELKREGKLITDLDLYILLNKGDKSGDAVLHSGDVLYIPPAGAEVALIGSVRSEAIYELRGGESISDLLTMAGGTTALAQNSQISIERIDESGSRSAFHVALNQQGYATALINGDILRLDPIPSKYSELVTLRGSVASPGHYRWHKGMHLSELMPEREALETRNYWWHRTQLGLPAPEFLGDIQNLQAQSKVPAVSQQKPAEVTLQLPLAQTNWSYAVIERLDPATMRTYLIPFDPGRLVLQHEISQDLELEPGDVITFFTQDDIALPTTQRTRYVRLEGEFQHAGIYSVAPGESLRSIVSRAGGLTTDAYLYGSEFTRRSTRELEQQRLDEYTNRLEQEMRRGVINTVAEPSAQTAEAAALNKEMLDRVHRLKATGRIVLDLHAQNSGVDALPDLALEDGDRLVIPARPSTVQVIGAVMNPNAFLYRPHERAEDYLREAGGPSREADKSRIFILRADGSVTRSEGKQSIFASNSNSQHLNPGDTIIVPEKLWRPSVMNQVMPWVQLITSLSLSAAVVNALK
jgi:protein involved in polysaccharide export with SLBB domain